MNAIAKLTILVLTLFSSASFAQASAPSQQAPKLSNDAVLAIAIKTAEAKGISLSKFEAPKLSFHPDRHEWFVFFIGKPINGQQMPGNLLVLRSAT